MPSVVLNKSNSKLAKRFESLALLLCWVCFGFSSSAAYAFDFLTPRGAHPIAGLTGIPGAHYVNTTRLVGSGQLQSAFPAISVSLQTDHSNIFAGGSRDRETVVLDGETTRTSLAVAFGVGRCWQVAGKFQQVGHRAGSLDRLIEKWHTFFNLPNAQRDQSERDRLAFVYESDGNQQLTLRNTVSGIGDTQLQVSLRADCALSSSLPGSSSDWLVNGVWFAGVKLPTGSLEEFSGSEETDFFLGFQSGSLQLGRQLKAGLRAGLLFPGETEALPQLSSAVFFANTGLQWQPAWLQKIRSVAALQLDMHSPLFESNLRELGAWSGQLGLGLTWHPAEGHQLAFALLEDVVIDTSPDLVFHIKYRVSR